MSEALASPVVLDATVLSNFANSDSVEFLTTTLANPHTVPAVRTELEQGVAAGYRYLDAALDIIDSGDIGMADNVPDILAEEYDTIQTRLDAGEAEALVAAHTAGGTLATDDGAARSIAGDYDVSLTGSIGLLVRGVVLGAVSIDTADEWLTTWVEERNYYAPVDTVTEALPDGYEQ